MDDDQTSGEPRGRAVDSRSGAERTANTPPHLLRPGLATRHEALHITPATRTYRRNSILEPGIDMAGEVARINEGLAIRLRDNRYLINGRVWVDKGDGYTFPQTGERVRELNSAQFNLFKVYLEDGGRSPNADKMILNNPYLDHQAARAVEALFDLIQDFGKRQKES